MEKLIIGSRGSKLALKYAEIAKKAFLKELDIEIEIKKIITDGDLVKGIVDKGDFFEASTFILHKDQKVNEKVTNTHKK